MQLELEKGFGNTIQSFSGGRLKINNEDMQCNVIVSADRIIKDWAPPPVSELSIADLEPVFALDPEVILLGTGEAQTFPRGRLMTQIMRRGVGVEIMTTSAACRTYNVLMAEQRRVVAALVLDR
jgi:uncharacterized protein